MGSANFLGVGQSNVGCGRSVSLKISDILQILQYPNLLKNALKTTLKKQHI